MDKTTAKRFLPGLLLMLVGCLWGISARAVERTVTYTVSSATAVATSGIAPSGSSAKFVNTCTVAKDQLTGSTKMTLTLSGYTGLKITGLTLSMRSNSSSGAGYLDVKAGTTQLAAIGKSSAALGFNNAAWHGSWSTSYVNVNVSLTDASYVIQDNEDVVIVVGANTNSLYCRSFTLTYEEGPATPVLHTSHTSLSFGKVETGTDKQQSFTLSGHNLTADASLSVTGSDSEQFKIISPGVNFAPVEGTIAETDVTVTYAPTATGAHTATLTIASGEITKEIALSGTGIAPLVHYTVSWRVNGEAYTAGTPTTDVTDGGKVTTLPTTPTAIGDNVFVGWTNMEISTAQDDAPAVLFTTAADAPAVTSDVTYYAVYAIEKTGNTVWKRIKTLAEITDGSYVIKNANFILPSTYTGGSKTPGVVTAPTITGEIMTGVVGASMIWSFKSTGATNQFYIKNADGNYLYETNNNDGIRVGSTTDRWTFTVNTTDYFSMQGAKNERYCATYKSQDWRSYLSATHSNYANGGRLELYKKTIGKAYSDYATTVSGNTLEARNLSFGETTAFDVYGTTFTAPTLSGATVGVTYTSSNEAVATVNVTTGEITLGTAFGTTTITAAADKNADYLAGEVSYTLSVWPTSITGIKQLFTSTTAVDFKDELNNATITYVNGNNVYLQDDKAAILMYLSSHTLTAGKSYTGRVTGQGKLYNGLHEITVIDLSGITPADNTKAPKTVTLAALNANFDAYESMYVKVKGVTTGTFTTSGSYQLATITQETDELQLKAPSTLSLIENNDYDFVGFPGCYNSDKQFNIWEEGQAINRGKFSANLAFEQESYTVEIDKTVVVKATNASDAAIEYSVEGNNCTINATTGEFTATATGTYTVTAVCAATETYIGGTTTCQVVVTPLVTNLHPTVLYKQITSKTEFVNGGVYLIACEKWGEAMGALDASNNHVSSSDAITIKDDKGFKYYDGGVNASGLPYEITISQAEDGTYNLYHAEGQYINGTGGTDFRFSETGSAGWSVAFNSSNVQISHRSKTNSYIQRHSTEANKYYKNYASGNIPVQLYQKVIEMNIHAKVKGYTTFAADFAYVMPAGLTGKTVSVGADGALKIDDAFQAGETVPALIPLLVRTSDAYAAEEAKKTYYPVVTTKDVRVADAAVSELLANNNLEYYRTDEGMTSSRKLSSPCYYKLSVDNEGNNPGFYWGAADGAPFKMNNGSTAYLACNAANEAAAAYFIDENGAAAIEGAPIAEPLSKDAVIYNLQGIRVHAKNLQRGIYIVNGRKTVVK